MKKMQITDFELTYDGMYFISWENRTKRVFLELNTILKMLQIEGLSYDDVDNLIDSGKPIHFKKVVMEFTVKETKKGLSFYTSEMSDEYLGLRNVTMIGIDLVVN